LIILITGDKGMLGRDLTARLQTTHQLIGVDLPEVDITEQAAIENVIATGRPDAVIHTAAFTAVDECELKPALALRVNAEGTRHLALACRQARIPLLYVSTDYVFDGHKADAYVEGDSPNPINVYGRSKLAGERAVGDLLERFWIVRTSWLYGPHGKNFVKTILHLAQRGESLRVVNDQVGSPTYTVDLAAALEQILEKAGPGIYHVTNQGYCSWFEFAREVLRQAGLEQVELLPIPTSASDRPAARPRNSRLAGTRLAGEGLDLLPPWQDALCRYLAREAPPSG
jgi:dTDP-4-dehydrorhamnose reductase